MEKNASDIISFIIMKKLMCPYEDYDSFSVGLIDDSGNYLREFDAENDDLVEFILIEVRRLLGSKIVALNGFIYTKMFSHKSIDSKIMSKTTTSGYTVIKRMKKDVVGYVETQSK